MNHVIILLLILLHSSFYASEQIAPSKAVFVLGMHRSGTSTMTGLLNHLGVYLGHNLIPPTKNNPKGFFEHKEIAQIHNRFMKEIDRCWFDPRPMPQGWQNLALAKEAQKALANLFSRDFSGVNLWGLKDPRLCRLVPLWLPLLEDLHVDVSFVLMIRSPAEVAESLQVRDKMSGQIAQMLWLHYVLEAEQATRGYPRSIVHYRELVDDPMGWLTVANRLAIELQVTWPVDLASIAPQINDFITPELYHQKCENLVQTLPLFEWVKEVERAFAPGKDSTELRTVCDLIRSELASKNL